MAQTDFEKSKAKYDSALKQLRLPNNPNKLPNQQAIKEKISELYTQLTIYNEEQEKTLKKLTDQTLPSPIKPNTEQVLLQRGKETKMAWLAGNAGCKTQLISPHLIVSSIDSAATQSKTDIMSDDELDKQLASLIPLSKHTNNQIRVATQLRRIEKYWFDKHCKFLDLLVTNVGESVDKLKLSFKRAHSSMEPHTYDMTKFETEVNLIKKGIRALIQETRGMILTAQLALTKPLNHLSKITPL